MAKRGGGQLGSGNPTSEPVLEGSEPFCPFEDMRLLWEAGEGLALWEWKAQ